MANTTSATVTTSNADLLKKIAELEAQLAAKANARKINIGISEYGKGTVMITGFGRFPFSFYTAHLEAIVAEKVMEKALEFAHSHADELRAAAYAADYCDKAGLKWTQGGKNEAYKTAYDAAKLQAMKDSSLVSSRSK